MFGCRPTSTSFGERIHMEQSLVGKVLSSWAMWPPDAGRLLHQIDFKTRGGKIQGGLDTADPTANHHHVPEIALCNTAAKLFNLFFFQLLISLPEF